MIDIEKEDLLTIKEARKQIPGRPSMSTVFRWLQKGVRGAKLESIRVGGRLFTSAEAIERFIAAQQSDGSKPKTKRRSQAIANAKEVLDAFDI